MTARALFVAPDGRPRALWRIVVFVALLVVFYPLALTVVAPVVGIAMGPLVDTGLGGWIAACVALLGAHWAMLALVDRRGWDAVAMSAAAARPRALAEGLLVGLAAIALPVLVLLGLGWLRLEPGPEGSSMAQAAQVALVLAPAALAEELLMRGYLFATLREGIGLVGALLTTSIAFGLLHLANPGVSSLAIAMVALAGVLLGMVLVATRSLYAAWIAHLAWNFALAAIFHVAVSGQGFVTPDYRLVDAGPDWATGGPWGPEGGLAAGLGMTLGLAYLITRPSRREETRA